MAEMNRRGYVLLGVMFLLLLLAVVTLAWSRQVGMRARMSAHGVRAIQSSFAERGLAEAAVWQLTRNPSWRTGTGGVAVAVGGVAGRCVVRDAAALRPGLPAAYSDVIGIVCAPSGSTTSVRAFTRYFIDTAAGGGGVLDPGSGLSATQVQLNRPVGVAVDSAGNLYLADQDNHRVCRVSPDGVLTRFAGIGAPGFSGDGGQATQARLNTPRGLAVNAQGELFIADSVNNRIRKVAANGIITTVAGSGPTGDHGDHGKAIEARLNAPGGVFVTPQDYLYIADTGNHRVRLVMPTGNIETVAGTGEAGYSGDWWFAVWSRLFSPSGVAVDAQGVLYIADTYNHRVRRVSQLGIITTVAGTGVPGYFGDGGEATLASLNQPRDVALDGSGNLFIAEEGNSTLRVVAGGTSVIKTLAGTGGGGYNGDIRPAVSALLDSVCGVAMPAVRGGRAIYVGDRDNNRVRVLKFQDVPELY